MLPERKESLLTSCTFWVGLERYASKNNMGFRNDGAWHGAKSNELATASPSSGGQGVGEIGGRTPPLQLLML